MTLSQDTNPEMTLAGLARESLKEYGGIPELAIDALTNRLQKDKKLLQSIISQVVYEAVQSAARHEHRATRRSILSKVIPSRAASLKVVLKNSTSEHRVMLLDMPLSDGTRLRDATRVLIVADADRFRKTAKDANQKCRFFDMVASGLKNDRQIVGRVFTEDKLVQMFEEAA